ncbi:MAG: phosphatidylglycerol lysyltransferase domain-containing protein [Bacteroidales bacterium]
MVRDKIDMFSFKEITLKDKIWINELLQYSDFMSTEYCFTSLYIWRNVYKKEICRYKDFLLVRSIIKNVPQYLYPAGNGSVNDIKEIIELYSQDAKSFGAQLFLVSILNSQKELLENIFPDRFSYNITRDSFDYIYLAEDLITLHGKKFQSKRNHIARFKELSGWEYESISKENLQDCAAMNKEWCARYGCRQNLSMSQESCSVKNAIDNFDDLKLSGGLLRLNGKVIAFTIGEMLNSDTFIIHIEKAFADIKGAYPTISQEFLLHIVKSPLEIGFKYVNREDDAGDKGLRTAKMQYNPEFLLEKWGVCEK